MDNIVCEIIVKLTRLIIKALVGICVIPPFLLTFEQVAWAVSSNSHLPEHHVIRQSASVSSALPTNTKNTWLSFQQAGNGNKFHISPFTHLPVLSDGSVAMPSNANNFHGAFHSSVDPRTGTASLNMPVATTFYDHGQAKRSLILSYSGSPSPHGPDLLGLGAHWTFNVGTEHPSTSEVAGHKTTDLTTGDGHTLTMESDRNGQGQTYWHLLRHKLKDVTVSGEPGDWTIATSNGIREHLLYGYEDWEEGHDGQRVWFYYDRNGPTDMTRRLLYICGHPLTEDQAEGAVNACPDNGVRITYEAHDITIHAQQTVTIHTGETEGETQVTSVTLPPFSSENISNHGVPAHILFSYDTQGARPWLIKTITQPSGQINTFLYNDEANYDSLQPHGIPTGFNSASLPVVKEQIITPPPMYKNSLPVRHVWFQYSKGTTDLHNFTGYLSGFSHIPGKDNLFDRADSYTYTVAQDNGSSTTTTTYNKYHLPLTITQSDDLHHSLVLKNDATYSPWKGTTFAQLPSDYSLPKKTTKTLYSLTGTGQESTIKPATVLEQKRYNNNGQVIWKQDDYGRQTFTQYCPPQGDAHCPAMDPNWPQATWPEKTIEIPAQKTLAGATRYANLKASDDPEPAVEVEYNYKLIPVAKTYKQRISQYKKLLQQQWIRAKARWEKTYNSHSSVSSSATTNLFSQSRFNHDVGQDTSSLAGSWEVSTKTVGTLPQNMVSHLTPGSPLPELTTDELSTKALYQYNPDPKSLTYGQLAHITITKYNRFSPIINGNVLQTDQAPLSDDQPGQQEQVDFNVTHRIDPKLHTRTTDVEVAHETPESAQQAPKLLKNNTRLVHADYRLSNDGELSLGQSVYSLDSGVKLSTEDTLKTLQTRWKYDAWLRPVQKTVTPVSGGHPQKTLWSYIFTRQEQASVKTMPNGSQEKVVYSGMGKKQKIISVWHRDKSLAGASMEGVSNWIADSKTTYTHAEKTASRTVYHADDNGRTVALTTTYGYDSLDRNVWTKLPDNSVSVVARNDPQLLLISYQVTTGSQNQGEKFAPVLGVVKSDTLGHPVAQYTFAMKPDVRVLGKPLYPPAVQAELTTLEDQLRPVTSLTAENNYGLLPLAGSKGLFAFVNDAINAGVWLSKSTMQYDGMGHKVEQTQPNGAKVHWKWQNNNLVATIAPNQSLIHDTINLQGKKVARCVKPLGQSDCHVLGTRQYDDTGELISQHDEYGNQIRYTYDEDGRMLSMITPATKTDKGHVFTYTYNSFARTGESVDGVLYETFKYDPDTWLLTDTDEAISHLHYDYDPNTLQLIKVTRSAPVSFKSPVGIHYPGGFETMSYNRYGQAVSLRDFAGNRYKALHDKLGRVIQTEVILPNQTETTMLTAVQYDDYFNRPVKIINGIGIARYFTYDALGKLTTTTDKQGNKTLQTLSYTYDLKTGNIVTFTRSEDNNSATQRYTYDNNTNNLTSMLCSVTGQSDKASSLCPRDTVLSGSHLTTPPVIMAQKYTFDDWNNIKSVSEKLVTSEGQSTSKTTTYTYASQNANGDHFDPHRMIAFNTQWQDSVSDTSVAPKTIVYDSLGRVIKDADGNTLHYNALGQQDGFTNVRTHGHTVYTYDATGHQVAEQPFDSQGRALQAPLYMIYQGDTVAEQVQNDATGKTHVSVELTGAAHSEDNRITRWYLHDYKGDVIVAVDASGQKISDHVYSPYGMDEDLLSSREQALPQKFDLATQAPWWKSHQPAFDGQMSDPVTGYQFLGGGYRAYNPVYRHFMSHDSYSPFAKINGYGFGDNNPIMNTDPTGHLPKWAGIVLGALGIGMAIASAVLLPIALTSAAIATGVGASVLSTATQLYIPILALGTMGVASGSLQIKDNVSANSSSTFSELDIALGFMGSISALTSGGVMFGAGVVGGIFGVEESTASLIMATGAIGAMSGVLGTTSSGMSIEADGDHSKPSTDYLLSIDMLNYINMCLMATAIILDTGTTFWMFAKGIRPEVSQRATSQRSTSSEALLQTPNAPSSLPPPTNAESQIPFVSSEQNALYPDLSNMSRPEEEEASNVARHGSGWPSVRQNNIRQAIEQATDKNGTAMINEYGELKIMPNTGDELTLDNLTPNDGQAYELHHKITAIRQQRPPPEGWNHPGASADVLTHGGENPGASMKYVVQELLNWNGFPPNSI